MSGKKNNKYSNEFKQTIVNVVGITNDNKTAEIGYVLSKKHWGKGYATEVCKAVIDELFRNGFTKIIAAHHVDNPASGRVMEKCGMSFIGYDKSIAKWGSDELCDVKLYKIVK